MPFDSQICQKRLNFPGTQIPWVLLTVIENKILDPVNVSIYGKGAVAPNPHNVMDGPMEWLRRHLKTPFFILYIRAVSRRFYHFKFLIMKKV